MLEVIQDVLDAEGRAEKVVGDARNEASAMRSQYADEESRRLKEAQAEADRLVRERLAAARDERDRRVNEAEARLQKTEATFEHQGGPRIDEAVAKAVQLVVGGRDG